MDKDQKDYEISFLGRDEKAAEALLKALKQHEAEILMEGPVEKIALEYKIEHLSSAYFGYIHFRIAPAAAKALEHDLATESQIIRFLIITPPFQKQKPRWEGRVGMRTRDEAPAVDGAEAPAVAHPADAKPEALPLTNEALEKRIEEILK
ncbi:MAG TPA: 30S ribosomal protein S6 [Candidatus Paceibacterota bacterium]|nr:30S ribosomal protein S6 [Candidatus Paceibacterota bacterium]